LSIADKPAKPDKWYQHHETLRKIYHPILEMDKEYYNWAQVNRPSLRNKAAILKYDLAHAGKEVEVFRKSSEEFVGFQDMQDEILASINYWVVKDEEFRKVCPVPPPKIFIIKGSSGIGKTALVHKIMVEAYDEGKKKGVAIYPNTLSPSKVYDKWLGESEKHIASAFDVSFMRPTVMFIDEAHSMMSKTGDSKAEDSGMAAYTSVQTTFLEKVSELIESDKQCVLILATNEFGSLLDTVKRRGSSGTIDLDTELNHDMLLAITQKQIDKYKLNLDATQVLKVIEDKVRALGHTSVTPADIVNVFTIVIEKKSKILRRSFLKKIEGKVASQIPEVNILDFRDIKQLKEYSEDRRSDDMKHIVQRIRPKQKLEDVGGLDGIKQNLLKDIEIALNHETTRLQGATPIRGVLLYGSAGCGKTYLAQAIAGELNATVYIIRGAQIVKPYSGQTEKLITDIFDEARKSAPSIIIIDEIDALTLKRDMGGNLGAVTTLLSEMGGIKPLEGVVVVGTTNKLQLVDEAFLRAGRFDRKVEIPPPRNDKERKEVIAIHLKKADGFKAPDVNPDTILEIMGKRLLSPAGIERLVADAIELRVKELNAIAKYVDGVNSMDVSQQRRVEMLYHDDLQRVYTALNKYPSDMVPDDYRKISANPSAYPLTLVHFKEAVRLSKSEQIENIQKFTQSIRGDAKPSIGKVYGLAALSGDDGSMASEGAVAVIECVVNPYADKGKSEVVGSEVANSIKASAEHARIFLNEQSDWLIKNYEFYIDFITFAKGMDNPVVSGPSAGTAITLAEFSAASNLKVLPNIVITGGITPKGELVQVGGLDFRGMGKFVAALNTEGIDTIIIPLANKESLALSDLDFFQSQGLRVIGASNFWQVAKIALEAQPIQQEAISMLKDMVEQRKNKK